MNNHIYGKLTASLISGLAASFWGIYGPVIVCVLVAICMDVVSGLVASMAAGEKISSQVGWIGFWKKMALILALAFGIFMDSFIPTRHDLSRAAVYDADRNDRRLLYSHQRSHINYREYQ